MAFNFDIGSTEYLEADVGVVSAYPYSMSCWFYVPTGWGGASATAMYVGDKDVSNDHYASMLIGNDQTVRNYTRGGGAVEAVSTSTNWSLDTWHNGICVWVRAIEKKVWLDNGGLASNTNAATPANIDRVSIGRNGDSTPGWYADFYLAECAIWDIQLTAGERATLAAGYSPLFVRPASLVFYQPLVRNVNWRHMGPALTASGTTVVRHPPIRYTAPAWRGSYLGTAGGQTGTRLLLTGVGI